MGPNKDIVDLNKYLFNEITFEDITLFGLENLASVESDFFSSSKDRLHTIRIFQSQLTSETFPFSSIDKLPILRHLEVSQAQLGVIPKLSSSSLSFINLSYDIATDLPSGKRYIKNSKYICAE